ncbi:MAG: PepSY domain-containing protein [Acidobacteriota bacterium]
MKGAAARKKKKRPRAAPSSGGFTISTSAHLEQEEGQMNRITCLAIGTLVAVAATASAASPTCTLHPKKGATPQQLATMAKVTSADARKAALATFKDPSKATLKDAELEAEHGCLVYSFDIEVAGQRGVQEVQIDAGNGKVISSKHESPKAEAAERAKDASARPKN